MSIREKAKMKRPKHAAEGLAQGVKSIFTGVEQGITGTSLDFNNKFTLIDRCIFKTF